MMNRLMKKIAIVLAAATIATTTTATVTSAATATVAATTTTQSVAATSTRITVRRMQGVRYVKNEAGANVRRGPYTTASIVKKLPNNTKVQITGKTSNGWYQVYMTDPVRGGKGYFYISGNLLVEKNQAYKKQYTVKVSSTYLGLRKAPTNDDDAIIGKLYNGDTVHVLKGSGTYWYVVVDKTGKRGYVNSNFLV